MKGTDDLLPVLSQMYKQIQTVPLSQRYRTYEMAQIQYRLSMLAPKLRGRYVTLS